MNVLLFQSYLGRREKNGNVFPLGLCYIATALSEHRHDVRLCDLNLYENPYLKIQEVLTEDKPDIVGISLRNIDSTDRLDFHYYYETLSETLGTIKTLIPTVPVMIGGAGFSLFAYEIMERHPELDYGVYLEGEDSAPELLDHLESPEIVKGIYYRKLGRVHFSGYRPFPSRSFLRAPNREFAEIDKYKSPLSIGVQAKRGCILECSYCNYPSLNGKQLRIRPVVDVVDEIEELKNNGVNEIIFTDSVFNIPHAYAVNFCHELINRKIKIKWSAWFALNGLNEDFIRLAKRSGCYRMCLSPDGVTNDTLRSLKKNHHEEDVWRILRYARNNSDIDFRFTMICGSPGQSFREAVKAAIFIIRAHVFMKNSRCLVSWIRILPNTEIFVAAKEEGMIESNTDLLPRRVKKINHLFYKPARKINYVNPLYFSVVKICALTRVLVYGLDFKKD